MDIFLNNTFFPVLSQLTFTGTRVSSNIHAKVLSDGNCWWYMYLNVFIGSHVVTDVYYVPLQTMQEISTLENDIKGIKEAIDAKNAPMMVS